MSNCGKWLNKTEFNLCVLKAMSKHEKALFNETPDGDSRRHWMYSIMDDLYKDYVEDMKDWSEDWSINIDFNGKGKWELYVACDDHKAEYSHLTKINMRMK